MESDLEARVKAVIADETGYPLSRLSRQTDLCRDLGVFGDTAEELLLRLGDAFGIDLENIQFSRHFLSEPHHFNPLPLFALLLPGWWPWWRERVPVTIGDLVEAARTKHWPIRYGDTNA